MVMDVESELVLLQAGKAFTVFEAYKRGHAPGGSSVFLMTSRLLGPCTATKTTLLEGVESTGLIKKVFFIS